MTKEEEAEAVREFVRLLPLPGATFEPDESPDFVLTLADGRKVGLEVTEVHVENQAKGYAVAEQLCEEVKVALASRRVTMGVVMSIPHLYVGFSVLRPGRRAELAGLLAKLFEGDVPALANTKSVHHEREELTALGIDEVGSVTVNRNDGLYVGTTSSGMGSRGGVAQLGIDKKNRKVETYRAKMSGAEQWLLLVTGRSMSSSIWSRVLEDEFVSKFDHTFVLDCYEAKAFRLDTKAGAATNKPAG
jgi:hypothetical protein